MKFSEIVSGLLLSFTVMTAVRAGEGKLIEWGWGEPGTKFLKEHAAEMQRFAFDGVVFHLSPPGKNFTWEAWGPKKFSREEFRQDIENLKTSKLGRLTDNFVRLNITPGTGDWFDEAVWENILQNSRHAAAVVAETGCRGILLDTEQYQGEPFHFRKLPPRPLAEYRARVRECGREWISAVNEEAPEIVIFCTFAYATARPRGEQALEDSRYALLPDFLDGILEACSPQTIVIDGFEQSYGYKKRDQFHQARKTIREEALQWTAVPERYRQHMRASFGIWMDYNLRDHGWHPEDFQKNYFTPDEFESAVRSALAETDRYVWIYTEQPRWWTNEKLPIDYVEVLRRARIGSSP